MSLDFYKTPEIEELIARVKTYVKGELKTINPTDKNNVLFSLIVALANLTNDNNQQILLDILPNIFPQYCKAENALENHAYIKNVPRNQATSATGKATIQGLEGNSVPLGAILIANNIQYRNSATADIMNQSISLSSLSVNGTLVTATTSSNHSFASGMTVNISGASTEQLNGDFQITVTGLNSFTYSIQEEMQVTETDNLQASANMTVLTLKSTTTGSNTNLSNGDSLALSEAIEGVEANAYVQFSGISGGTDVESFDSWKAKVVDRYRNPITFFNVENIKLVAESVSGVTKVWIYPITPEVGQVTIYFIRGNDDDIIPDFNEIQQVKDAIVSQLMKVNDDSDDIIVDAPTKKVVNFTFSSVTPNTSTMKNAIKNSLKQFFEDDIDLGLNLKIKDINNAIGNSYDSETGTKLQDYTLDTPSVDISIGFGELPVLGDVTFL